MCRPFLTLLGVASILAGESAGQSCGSLDPASDSFASCTCDLTVNDCDQNCCCDPDCSAADRASFTGCIITRPAPLRRCVYKDILVRNNTQFTVDETDDGLFCVLVDNNDGRTYYEQLCSPATAAQFATLRATVAGNDFQFAPGQGATTLALPRCVDASRAGLSGCTTRSASSENALDGTVSGGYVFGGVIYTAFQLTGSSAISYVFGLLALPQPATSDACTDDSPVGFGVNAEHTCSRQLNLAVTTGRSGCAAGIRSAFDVTSYLEPTLLLRPTTDAYLDRTLSTATDDTSTVSITCETITVRGLDGSEFVHDCSAQGTVNSSDFALNCSATTTTNTTTVVTSPGGGTTQTITVASTGSVRYPVAEVHYTINRTTLGIVSATARFVVLDTVVGSLLPYALQQTHSVVFEGGSSQTTFPRSGNPGYLLGKPVLAGEISTAGDSIVISSTPADWLFVPKVSSNLLCSSINVSLPTGRNGVDFGFNLVTGCSVPVTVENYTDTAACTALRATTLSHFSAFVNTNNMIGIYGNSNPSDINDWVTILDSTAASWGATYSGTDSNYECARVLVGLRLELLTAKVGPIDRAQNTIVGARYVPVYDTERFLCTNFYCDTALAASTRQQVLQLTFTVAFLDVTQTTEGVNEHQPDVIRKLPKDFFFPFS
eukprot:m.429180 g.429180  ORF g.429180 m.429180 type:complete len:661 (+) comp16972_c0_seq1:1987-3969(+)